MAEISFEQFVADMKQRNWRFMEKDDVAIDRIEVGSATLGDKDALGRLKDLLHECERTDPPYDRDPFLYEHAMFIPEGSEVVKLDVLRIIIRNIEQDNLGR